MDDGWFSSFVTTNNEARVPVKPSDAGPLLQPTRVDDAKQIVRSNGANGTSAKPHVPSPPSPTIVPRARSTASLQQCVSMATQHPATPRRGSSDSCLSARGDVLDPVLAYTRSQAAAEDDLLEASHGRYCLYQHEVDAAAIKLDSLLQSTNASLGLLSSLRESFRAVEAQTSAFQAQCQNLLAEQKRVTNLAADIKENLRYYDYLEPYTRRLNAPTAASLVHSRDFPELLTNLDACLDYMQAHPKQREAATYQSRYRLLLTRALTLIRSHFAESLKNVAVEISQRNDPSAATTTLLYAKFRVISPELKQLGLEIQKRAVLPADAEIDREPECQGLVNDLYNSYTSTRGRLLLPVVSKRLAEIAATDRAKQDVVHLAQDAMSYIRGICLDEYELWGEFFVGDGAVYDYLETICEPMYDHLRPRIIHEVKLAKLCELCSAIQTRYVSTEDYDSADEADFARPSIMNQTQQLDFATLIQPALADAQTRLVFLALAALRDDIERFKPTPQDLDYPARNKANALVNGKQVALSGTKATIGQQSDKQNGNEMFTAAGPVMDGAMAWYPTLPKAVGLLGSIYRLINSTVFDDLAHRIVYSTTQSLLTAAGLMTPKLGSTDSNLFLISQLLGLKQQIVAFDIEYVTTEVSFDFSTLTDTFYELRERGGFWNPATWYKLATGGLLPRVVENMLDAKSDLDGRLPTAINDLVNEFATRITAPLSEVSSSPTKAEDKGIDAGRATTAVRGLAEKELVVLRRKLAEYLSDARTRETLVAAVREQVVLMYEAWMTKHEQASGSGKLAKVSRKGKGREDEVWGSDVFAEWCERAFAVGAPGDI